MVHQGKPSSIYDDSFDNGTVLMMKDLYESMAWNSSAASNYANSAIHSYLNNDFIALIDADIRAQIKQVKVPYRIGNSGSTVGIGVDGVPTYIWMPGALEIGFSGLNGQVYDGAVFSYFSGTEAAKADAKRIAYLDGTAFGWWTRTSYGSTTATNIILAANDAGGNTVGNVNLSSLGVRPTLVLPSSLGVNDTGAVVLNQPPTAPPSITTPGQAFSGQSISLSCGESTDADGDAITYIWERAYNGGAYAVVQSTGARTFSETVSTAWNTLQYRVKAADGKAFSAYASSGTITVIHNQPPAISGSDGDLGIKREGFGYGYTVTDADSDTVNVVEKLDGATIATKNGIVLGAAQTAQITGNSFTALTNAQHMITIQATDSAGGVTTRTLTFTKAISGFVIALSEPFEVAAQPVRCFVTINRDIPAGGTMMVEVCNNPFDVAPTWEDCTAAVVSGLAYVFANDVNTATQKGISVRVSVERGTALMTCWISGIGVNFE